MPSQDPQGSLTGASEDDQERSSGDAKENRVGCASEPIVLENVEQSPSGEPFSDDLYTTRLHNPDHDQGLSVSERSGKRSGSC